MGDEGVCLTLRTDEIMADDKCSRMELKRSYEHIVDANNEEHGPKKKPAIESLNNDDSSRCLDECVSDVIEGGSADNKSLIEPSNNELKHSRECVADDIEAESMNNNPAIESSNDEISKCLDECVLDSIEVDTPNKKPEIESLSDEKLERSCECVVDITEAENLNKKPAIEFLSDENSNRAESTCLDECAVEAMEVETPNKMTHDENSSRVELKWSLEHVVDAIEAETPNKKPALEYSEDENSTRVESKFSDECVVDAIEVETLNNKPPIKSSNDGDFSRVELKRSCECIVDVAEAESPNKKPAIDSSNDKNFTRVELKCLSGCVVDAIAVESHNNKPPIESSNDVNSLRVEINLNECDADAIEVGTPDTKPAKDSSNDENPLRLEITLNECDVDANEVGTPDKKLAKESSTESSSEVLNPNVSPQENTSSSQTVSSLPVEGLLRSGCGEITPSSAGDSSTEIADKEGHCINDLSTSLSKSQVVLEGSKDASSRGVKRIIIKFSKSNNSHDKKSTSTIHPSYMEVDNGLSNSRLREESNLNPLERKLFEKDMLENYTTNVKKLLSTGVLEGVEVKYINQEKKPLRGIIKDCGYLCGCAVCNFSKVLDSYEFEQHAGCRTKHPNDHIVLSNGKSIYSIVHELTTTPVRLLEGAIRGLVGSLFNEKSYLEWKESLETENFLKNEKKAEKNEKSHLNLVDFSNSTMSCSSEDTEDSFGSASRSMMQKFPVKHKISTVQVLSEGRKRFPKKSTSPIRTGGRVKKRDNDLHKLLFMPNGLPDGAELAYYAKGQRVLDGYKQGNGIVCSCCDSEVSPSQFEAHAGCAAKRQPYRHIYTHNGVSLHDISLSLANGQCLAISNSGDMCTVCGEGGDLILCEACPHAFHAACLDVQSTPEGDWCCPHCKDKIRIGRKVVSSESVGTVRPITIRLTRVVKAPATEIGGCVICRAPDFSVMKFDERTVIFCDQCEREYHVGCLRKRGLCDLKELPKGKWFCCDHCNRIHATLQKLTLTGAEAIPASMLSTINRKLIGKGITFEVGDVQWQLLNGKFDSLEHQSMLFRAITIFRDSFDPIVERSGRDLIPAMVYGQSVSGQEFGGIYCAVLSVKSVVVSAGLLRIFGQEVAELPLVATTKESQGMGYFQVLFTCMEKLLRFLNVEKLVLPAAEDAESIWTDKFGFKKIAHDQFQKYTKDFQLISFKGTLMLEKAVPRHQ